MAPIPNKPREAFVKKLLLKNPRPAYSVIREKVRAAGFSPISVSNISRIWSEMKRRKVSR